MPGPFTAIVSARGRVSLPDPVRRARCWEPGTRLVVENTPEGVLLKPAPAFPETRPEDVFGSVARNGPPLSLEDMEAGVLEEAKRRDEGA